MRIPLYYSVFHNTKIKVINFLNSVIRDKSYLIDELIDISFLQEKKNVEFCLGFYDSSSPSFATLFLIPSDQYLKCHK